mmetsp:Transcript_16749/g.29335  ORF Transcript_16749/g.29335 Transcript_16749/m.29335 type:complete len:136 (+) Transcript_16749:1476-1883(+)
MQRHHSCQLAQAESTTQKSFGLAPAGLALELAMVQTWITSLMAWGIESRIKRNPYQQRIPPFWQTLLSMVIPTGGTALLSMPIDLSLGRLLRTVACGFKSTNRDSVPSYVLKFAAFGIHCNNDLIASCLPNVLMH